MAAKTASDGSAAGGGSTGSDAPEGPANVDVAQTAVTNDSLAEEPADSLSRRQRGRRAATVCDDPLHTDARDVMKDDKARHVDCVVPVRASDAAAAATTTTTGATDDLPTTVTKWQAIRANRNVFRVLCFCFLDGGAFSIWNMHIFQVLIKIIGTNQDVGWMSAFSGVSQMVAAVLVGFIGEKFLRQSLLRIGAVCGFTAVLLSLLGVFKLNLTILYIAQLFWGAYSGTVATATEAIFADSIATGRRAFIYNIKWIDQTMSSVIGTFIALIILLTLGNTWARPAVVKTMYGGLILHPVAMLVLFTMRDKYSLKEDDDSEGRGAEEDVVADAASEGGDDGEKRVSRFYPPVNNDDAPMEIITTADGTAARFEAAAKSQRSGKWGAMRSSSSQACLRGGGRNATGDGRHRNAHHTDVEDDEEDADRDGFSRGRAAKEDRRTHDAEEFSEDVRHAVRPQTVMATVDHSGQGDKTGEDGEEGVRGHAGGCCLSQQETASVPASAMKQTDSPPQAVKEKHVSFLNVSKPAEDGTSAASSSSSSRGGKAAGPSLPPVGRGERELIRYLNHQAAREHEAFHSEQNNLKGQPLRQLVNALHYYLHLSLTWEAVPFYACLVDFLVAFGSGMTLRFLPLYFIESKHASPVTLMAANLLICPVQAALSHVVQVIGTRHTGRITSTILMRLVGTVLMLLMGLTDMPLPLLIPVFIFRNAMMNSTRGVTRSVIMDAVKKENRAKWSAFESFSSFTWAGSAVLGGYLADARGYQFSFTVTALFHFFALSALVPAAIGSWPVEREMMRESRERKAAKEAARRAAAVAGGGAMTAQEVTVVAVAP